MKKDHTTGAIQYCTCGCEKMYIVQSIHIWERVQDDKKQERQKCPAGTRQTDGKNWGLVWRNRKKISQIIKDYSHLPFFLLIILWLQWMRAMRGCPLELNREYKNTVLYRNGFLRFKEPGPFKLTQKTIGDCIGILFGSIDTSVDPPLLWPYKTFKGTVS